MVERPARASVGGLGNPLLAGDQNPASSIVRPDLLSVDQLGMLRDQLLEMVLVTECLLLYSLQCSLLTSYPYSLSHSVLLGLVRDDMVVRRGQLGQFGQSNLSPRR